MELKGEYKQPGSVMAPEGWEVKSLGSLASFKTGPFGSALHKSDYVTDGVPLVNPMHIVDGKIVPSSEMTVTEQTAKRLSEYALQEGDVIIGRRGEMGRCAVVGRNEAGWLCGTGSLIIRPNEDAVAGYLQLVLASRRMIAAIENASVGTTMVNLNQGILGRLPVLAPPLPEQRAIAAALSDVNELIARLDALIAKKRAIKTAAMQRLLTGEQRLPGFVRRGGHKQTGVGALPIEWAVRTADELCLKIQDGTHFSPELGGDDFLYVTSKHIGKGVLDVSSADRISASEHTKIYSRCDVRKGDLLLTKDGANTGNAALNHLDEEFSLLSSVAFLRFDDGNYEPSYFLHYVLSEDGQKQIEGLMSGNAITRLTLQKIRNLKFPVPPLAEQQAIAEVLSDMDAEVEALEARREKTEAIKQGMMQELLTGRTRLV